MWRLGTLLELAREYNEKLYTLMQLVEMKLLTSQQTLDRLKELDMITAKIYKSKIPKETREKILRNHEEQLRIMRKLERWINE